MRTLTIVAALVIWAGVAEGGFYTGNDLSERCKSEGTIGPDLCRGYVTGSADTLTNTGKICAPRQATDIQAVAVVRKYLQQHPERLHLPAASLVRHSLMDAFPCPKK